MGTRQLRRTERNLTPLQENSWERISSVGKRGEKGMAQLEGKVQTDLLWLPKSSAVPKDSQTDWTVNNPHCWANLTRTGKSSDFVNGLWYLMSAHEWKWLETWGLWENLMPQNPMKSSTVFFLQNWPMTRVCFHLVLNSCGLCRPQVSNFVLMVKFFVGVWDSMLSSFCRCKWLFKNPGKATHLTVTKSKSFFRFRN